MNLSDKFRTNTDDYFRQSGIREAKILSHHPFILLEKDGIDLCNNIKDLLDFYPDDLEVLAQWGGQWRSDFFYFTVGDLRRYIEKNPKADYQIA